MASTRLLLMRAFKTTTLTTATTRTRGFIPLVRSVTSPRSRSLATSSRELSPGADLAPELRAKIAAKDEDVRAHHTRPAPDIEARRKRLVWRSKQRGWREVDLLLGSWATENVPTLSDAQLDEYERILNLETIDIFNLISGRLEPAPQLEGEVLHRLQEHAKRFTFMLPTS